MNVRSRQSKMRFTRSLPMCAMTFAMLAMLGCTSVLPPADEPLNPFVDLEPIELDGVERNLETEIVPLGDFDAGDVLRVSIDGDSVTEVLILTTDELFEEAGVMVGGGPANEPFQYRIPESGRYFAFAQFDPLVSDSQRVATITASFGDEAFRPPSEQNVLLVFEDGFLTDPGLFDTVDGTPDQLEFLESIGQIVRGQIVERVQAIYADTPVMIFEEGDALPDGPMSTVTFTGERVLAEDQDVIDAALPAPDPTRPQCQVRVIFGEVLPRGASQDTGNRVVEDDAGVYVGSLTGRGEECQTSVINSLNNVVLTLSQTAAHEIGHLIGLRHVEQIDIMNRSATLAFQRELEMVRGQVQFDRPANGTVVSEVLTTIIQDPARYMDAVFDTEAP
ncbi:MAG TPA: hypothetical protein PKN33_10770 [Phycisphaerae bacterium]|nr:hypothetical protein [Phycisphaerae bacterium]